VQDAGFGAELSNKFSILTLCEPLEVGELKVGAELNSRDRSTSSTCKRSKKTVIVGGSSDRRLGQWFLSTLWDDYSAGTVVFTEVTMKSTTFWDVVPCSPAEVRYFRGKSEDYKALCP
jgi:hypothetical protein